MHEYDSGVCGAVAARFLEGPSQAGEAALPTGPRRDGAALTLRPVRVETGSADEEGRLVFHDGKLVAVLLRLSEQHGDMAGRWFLEHGFGPLDGPPSTPCHPDFDDLGTAREWIGRRLGGRPEQPA